LVARPLTLYTSGGVEKVSKNSETVKPGTTRVKTGQSEAKIIRNPDGTTSVIYPDSDEEEEVEPSPAEPKTEVIKG